MQRIGNRTDLDRIHRDQALMAIMTAANETRGYLKATHDGRPRDVEREHAISNLWDICGIAIRRFDEDLSRRCELKGQYWRNPDEWTVLDINEARIGLETVHKEAQYLLRLKIRPHRTGA